MPNTHLPTPSNIKSFRKYERLKFASGLQPHKAYQQTEFQTQKANPKDFPEANHSAQIKKYKDKFLQNLDRNLSF